MSGRQIIPIAVLAAAAAGLWFLPRAQRVAWDAGTPVRARVVRVDNSALTLQGLLEYGSQHLEAEILEGPLKGRQVAANNEIRAQLDIDKKFAAGDTAVVIVPKGDVAADAVLVARDHWRNGWLLVLFGAFALLLAAFGGWTGVKALMSFVFSCLAVWKVLVPLCLAGYPAGWVVFGVVSLLTAAIMYLVAGATRVCVVAFCGAMLGVAAGWGLACLFGALLHVNGATMPFAQALLYSGYETLNLADLFTGAVILASSGAVMDLAMDIATGLCEVRRHNPTLGFGALFRSGVRMGRNVVGTMTTTLLLAYSGGYLTLLMVFAAQGTAPATFLNSTLVSAEVVKTLVGSFSLVLVAPFTAVAGAYLFSRRTIFSRVEM